MESEYRIKSKYGGVFVYNAEGNPVDRQTLAEIINGLYETYKQMDVLSQRRVERNFMAREVQRILSETIFHMPPTHPFACFGAQAYRKPTDKRFSGVYVLSTTDDLDTVKIGMSGDIYTRTKGIYHEYKSSVKLHAILEHQEYRLLEQFLHSELSDYNVGGEWFEAAPALDYIGRLIL